MIRSTKDSLYTGVSTNTIRRWNEHKSGEGAKWFWYNKPSKMVYVEEHPNQSEACKREYEIKQMSKDKKEKMIKEFYDKFR